MSMWRYIFRRKFDKIIIFQSNIFKNSIFEKI